jgi:hypothetical protein
MTKTAAIVASLMLVGLGLVMPAARADGPAYATFDARAMGAVDDFFFFAPTLVFPFKIPGGIYESNAQATAGPQGVGTAGTAPVPLATSLGIIIPQTIPVLNIPVPPEVQTALHSIDFTRLPNYCQGAFPGARPSDQHAVCGGPTQPNAGLGFTSDSSDGTVDATGNVDDPMSAKVSSSSHGQSAQVPGLQAVFRNAESTAVAGLNDKGIPEADATATLSGISLLGGAIDLGGMTSTTRVATDGTKAGTVATTSFSVQKATVLGVPVAIGPNGFSLLGKTLIGGDVISQLVSPLEKLLNVQGFKMHLFPASPVQTTGNQVSLASGGVEISYVTGGANQINVINRIGYTQASVNAVANGASDTTTPPDTSGSSADNTAGSSGAGSAPAGSSSSGGDAGAGAMSATPTDTGISPSLAAPPSQFGSAKGQAGSVSSSTGNKRLLGPVKVSTVVPTRLKSLYLGLLLFVVGAAALVHWRRAGIPWVGGRLRSLRGT